MFGKKAEINTSSEKIAELLTRGVEEIFVKEHLEKQLASGKQLRVKLGFDPTGSRIHIGRAILLRKLRAFQDLGHKVVFIVGDFTAQVGDPSDKLEKRPMLTSDKIEENLKDYKKQISKIINIKEAEFLFNSTWLSKLTLKEMSELAESFSVQQMSSRRNFKDRFDKGEEVSLREFLYPLMQGYDSVMVKADVELGGFDQLFNLKAGRTVQKHYGVPEQDILNTQMLEGTDGRKMSTSWGNVINITDEANDMYGKVMSVKDELLEKYFLLCTDLSLPDIEKIKTELSSGTNPKDIKMRLAREIVTMYHTSDAAQKAEDNFVNTFSKGGLPDDIKEVHVTAGSALVDVLLKEGIVASKSEFTRLFREGAITMADTGDKISGTDTKIDKNGTYKIGKRRFLKINIK